MKLRWSNGHNFAFEFEVNNPDSFHEQALSALRSFRIARYRRVHRGEIHKTVVWCEGCSLGVFDEDSRNWYYPEGEPQALDTQSWGTLSLNRHFDARIPFVESDSLESMHANCNFDLICLDPPRIESLDLSEREASDRLWNLCVGVYQHSNALSALVMSVGDAIDKHIDQNLTTDDVLAEINKRLGAAGRNPITRRRLLAIAKYEHARRGIGRQISRGTWLFARDEIEHLMPGESGKRRMR